MPKVFKMYLYIKYNLTRGEDMEIIISNNANKPIYEQITFQIKAMIMSEEPVSYTHLTLPTKA